MPLPDTARIPGEREQKATRAAFLVAGFLMAAWAPLVPLVQRNLHLEKKDLGLLLLCMGLGSILSMAFSGSWAARSGCRVVIVCASIAGALGLVAASVAPAAGLAAAGLLLFGAGVGGMDVVMNVQAIRVEEASGKSLMSGFHGFFSLGGILGAGGVTLLLSASLPPALVASVVAVAGIATTVIFAPGFLTEPEAKQGQIFALPKGVVVLIGLFCFVFFLGEGSVLDWSGVLLTGTGGLKAEYGGIGYVAFAIAMTIGRLTGDRVVDKLGPQRALFLGAALAGAGFVFSAMVTYWPAMILGYAAIGLGAANTVPVCFTATGKQTAMPIHLAVAAVSTMGYTGILSGPAAIGFVAQFSSLSVAMALVGGCLLAVAAGSRADLSVENSRPVQIHPLSSFFMAVNAYAFRTEWVVPSQIEEVSDILEDVEGLGRWWPSVYLDVTVLEPGGDKGIGKKVDLFTKGWLPYTLRWSFVVTESNAPSGFSLRAEGDFVGTGVWTLSQEGEMSRVRFDWTITADKPHLKRLSFLMKPLFEANHKWAMARGEQSLLLELRRRRGEREVPAPPPATWPHRKAADLRRASE